MDREELMRRYLDAETSVDEERLLEEADGRVASVSRYFASDGLPVLPEAGDEFDRIVGGSRRKALRTFGFVLSGIAAALIAGVFLFSRPDKAAAPGMDPMEMIRQLQSISELDPAEADFYEFSPVGDGYVMTARFPDGTTASFILTPMEGGESFHLVSLKD